MPATISLDCSIFILVIVVRVPWWCFVVAEVVERTTVFLLTSCRNGFCNPLYEAVLLVGSMGPNSDPHRWVGPFLTFGLAKRLWNISAILEAPKASVSSSSSHCSSIYTRVKCLGSLILSKGDLSYLGLSPIAPRYSRDLYLLTSSGITFFFNLLELLMAKNQRFFMWSFNGKKTTLAGNFNFTYFYKENPLGTSWCKHSRQTNSLKGILRYYQIESVGSWWCKNHDLDFEFYRSTIYS